MNKKEFKELDREQMIIAFNQLKDDYSSLFDELEQEKEKNNNLIKQLQEQNAEIEDIAKQLRQEKEKLKIAVAMLTKGTYPEGNEGDNDFDKQFIAVDKIKEKIEETNNERLNYNEDEYYLENEVKGYAIDKLKELLEEN